MDNGTEVTKVANYNTVEADDIDEACWTILNPDGDKLYVSSFGANAISIFDIGSDGLVTSTSPVVLKRSDFAPAGDTKDMFISEGDDYNVLTFNLEVDELLEKHLDVFIEKMAEC